MERRERTGGIVGVRDDKFQADFNLPSRDLLQITFYHLSIKRLWLFYDKKKVYIYIHIYSSRTKDVISNDDDVVGAVYSAFSSFQTSVSLLPVNHLKLYEITMYIITYALMLVELS